MCLEINLYGVAPFTAIGYVDVDADGEEAMDDAILNLGVIPRLLGIGVLRGVGIDLRAETTDAVNVHRLAFEAVGFLVVTIQNGVPIVV